MSAAATCDARYGSSPYPSNARPPYGVRRMLTFGASETWWPLAACSRAVGRADRLDRARVPGGRVARPVRELGHPGAAVARADRAVGQVQVGDAEGRDALDVTRVVDAAAEGEPGAVHHLELVGLASSARAAALARWPGSSFGLSHAWAYLGAAWSWPGRRCPRRPRRRPGRPSPAGDQHRRSPPPARAPG